MSNPDVWALNTETYDGRPAYKLPNGSIVTVEAWDSGDENARRAMVELDAEIAREESS